MSDPAPEKIQPTEIRITRAEGRAHLCGSANARSFDSFRAANAWLFSQSPTFPKTGGYDKHDFRITYADGEVYEGRLDCKAAGCADADLDVGRHVRDFLGFMAGAHRPAHMDEATYRRAVDAHNVEDEAKAWLATYATEDAR